MAGPPSPSWDLPSSPDSLFETLPDPASRTAAQIPGLYFTPSLLLPVDLSSRLYQFCFSSYFSHSDVNQVMLFERAPPISTGLPLEFHALLDSIESLLRDILPKEVHELLFPSTPTKARQAIVNMYDPGEGITPHIDLLGRFGDGIIGVSLGSGCVMSFASPSSSMVHEMYLPSRSVLVLCGEARYQWTHGIEEKMTDFVDSNEGGEAAWIERGRRISVTFRWLLPGAEIVGGAS